MVLLSDKIQCLKCSVFIVVLLSVGNSLATLPGRTANHTFKRQFLLFWEEESVNFERELRASESTRQVEMVKAARKGIHKSQMPTTVRVRQLSHSRR